MSHSRCVFYLSNPILNVDFNNVANNEHYYIASKDVIHVKRSNTPSPVSVIWQNFSKQIIACDLVNCRVPT